ncbi:ABC-type transport system, involved in lipoprotein release, permease component [Eubacterium ruminantium]|nr:ABC-type transport system, involved in lipoprotein release, permease component [Eubacterium ruminantium]
MKSRLSAMKYIRNNKRTCIVLILSLALTFMAMYIVAFTLYTSVESIKPICLEAPKRISYVNPSYEAFGITEDKYPDAEERAAAFKNAQNTFIENLKKHDGIDDAYYVQVLNANYNGVVGGVGYEFPLVEPEKIPSALAHMDAEIIEGRYPEEAGEVLIDEIVMKNRGMKVGDWFEETNYGRVFKIVGKLRSDYMFCIGTPNGAYNCGWYITILCNELNSDFTRLANEFGLNITEDEDIDDINAYTRLYEKDIKDSIELIINIIILVVMIFLMISILVAYISFMRNRVNEYCLYASLGYSRKEIYQMIMREMLTMFLIGVIGGIIISIMLMFAFDELLIKPQGLISKWFMPDQILRIAGAFAMVIGLLQIPVLISIYKVKTIDMMED